jgi:hypothetical protein
VCSAQPLKRKEASCAPLLYIRQIIQVVAVWVIAPILINRGAHKHRTTRTSTASQTGQTKHLVQSIQILPRHITCQHHHTE